MRRERWDWRVALATAALLAGAAASGAADEKGQGVPDGGPHGRRGAAAQGGAASFEQRAAELVQQMTLEEKIGQMGHRAPAIGRLGIPAYNWWNEALHGVVASSTATVFPQAIALGSTWDPELIFEVATVISTEARIKNITQKKGLTYWSPMINLSRDPRWGRAEESYSEDPYLLGRLATQFVKGLQGNDPTYLKAVATPKHYAANNVEATRHTGSSNVDERNLQELYLPAFRECVEEGKAYSVMCAYNAVNGVPCCANERLLAEILRQRWGFGGYVVSDCGAIRDIETGHHYAASEAEAAALGLKAGTDLNCGQSYQSQLLKAVQEGLAPAELIDEAVRRLFVARFKLGEFDPPESVPYRAIDPGRCDSAGHRALALKAAHRAIVLLKNEKDTLPLDGKGLRSVAVIGPMADRVVFGGYSGRASDPVSPLRGIAEKAASLGITVRHAPGCAILGEQALDLVPAEVLSPGGAAGEHGLKGEYFGNSDLAGAPALRRIDRVISFDWDNEGPSPEVGRTDFTVRWSGTLTAPTTRSVRFAVLSDDGARLMVNGKRVLDAWRVKGPTTVFSAPVSLEEGKKYEVVLEYFQRANQAMVHWGWDYLSPTAFQEAQELAASAEAALVFVGADRTVAREGQDRSDINLPGRQEALIQAVYEANPRTVVVLLNGNALALPWTAEHVPAIVEGWYLGQATGTALAEVLFGEVNPGGKLPVTFYKSGKDLPDIEDYDIIKGGRTYQYFAGAVLYPFGHGLSYTQFEYGNLKIEPESLRGDGRVTVSFEVKNVGQRAGDEVAQVYVHDVEASVQRPLKQLRGFRRVTLSPGQHERLSFSIPAADLAYYDVKDKRFVVEPGAFDVLVGSSSADIRVKGRFAVQE